MRLRACDTVFLLDYDMSICLSGAYERIGKKREDLPWIEEKVDENFKTKIQNFSNELLPDIYDFLAKYNDKRNVIIFRTRDEANDYLIELKKNI